MAKPRVLSGVQPTGNLHLGNYLGAIRNWVGMQDSHECLYMLADLHAITVPQDPAALKRNTRETAAAYIACGIDPNKSAIFPQSAVTMHSELAWILNNHTPLGWLERMTQFKEKSDVVDEEALNEALDILTNLDLDWESNPTGAKAAREAIAQIRETRKTSKNNRSRAQLGLFAYPVLMAADILGYHATHVPVGADQKQHLELARDIAGTFNRAYSEDFFPIPEPLIMGSATRVMSLTDGTSKMSKSDPSDYSRITLTDDADAIANKIKKAQTDSEPSLTYDEKNRPSVANLITIYAALSDNTPQKVVEQFSTLKTGQFKSQLADLAVAKLSPITAKMRELMEDDVALDAILKKGADKARSIAAPIHEQTMKRVGFLRV